jgi:hypothetical protein
MTKRLVETSKARFAGLYLAVDFSTPPFERADRIRVAVLVHARKFGGATALFLVASAP